MNAILQNGASREVSFDTALFREIEQGLDSARPERSRTPARVLGFGEISAVLTFDSVPEASGWVFKRLPVFATEDAADAHAALTAHYVELIRQRAGIDVQETVYFNVPVRDGLVVFYAAQRALPSNHIGSAILNWAPDDACLALFESVLRQVEKVWEFNRTSADGNELAIDLQLSNWAVISDDAKPTITCDTPLTYIDITTPLLRSGGVEQLNTQAFIRGCPILLRWPVRKFMAEGVVSRYYEPRTCVMDVIGNCIKEGREDLVPAMVDVANAFFAKKPASLKINPLTVADVFRYYRQDAAIFVIFLALKRMDRLIKSGLMRQPYDYILPERIERHFPWSNTPRSRKR
ncbi:MAG: hypothetical protein HUU46_12395 [Candidatus Hydrogenedentes bacterium]|nr:hypothetical protein [Candidatus Hydrogenedentota bacterium]